MRRITNQKDLPITIEDWAKPLQNLPTWDPQLETLLRQTQLRESSVLLPLYWNEEQWNLVFTRRSMNLRHHRGQISFPGGKKDPEDPNLQHTAKRETQEEIGIPLEQIQTIGQLPLSFSIAGFSILPVVGVLPEYSRFEMNRGELDEIFWVPIAELFLENRWKVLHTVQTENSTHEIYSYQWKENYDIWGATARILKYFAERFVGEIEAEPSSQKQKNIPMTLPPEWNKQHKF